MKVGTDGVLLGAWVGLEGKESHILDVGTGTGVIALMLAQRTETSVIVGIDIDDPSVEEARYNFKASPWGGRMSAFLQDFRTMEPFPYELIISNPPYFVNSLKAPRQRRSTARHTDTLPYSALVDGVMDNLAPEGRFAVVLPSEEAETFISEARGKGLYLNRLCKVKTTPERPPKRFLMEFAKKRNELLQEELVIQDAGGFTQEYKALTRDFYIKF